VADAEILYGAARGYAHAIPPIKTDAHGRFVLGIAPGTFSTLTALAPGFGPTLQRIKVGKEPLRVELALSAAHLLRSRVVDPQGKPIASANVSVLVGLRRVPGFLVFFGHQA
jgi:hypothetical protein